MSKNKYAAAAAVVAGALAVTSPALAQTADTSAPEQTMTIKTPFHETQVIEFSPKGAPDKLCVGLIAGRMNDGFIAQGAPAITCFDKTKLQSPQPR
jgi:hypothetical protein